MLCDLEWPSTTLEWPWNDWFKLKYISWESFYCILSLYPSFTIRQWGIHLRIMTWPLPTLIWPCNDLDMIENREILVNMAHIWGPFKEKYVNTWPTDTLSNAFGLVSFPFLSQQLMALNWPWNSQFCPFFNLVCREIPPVTFEPFIIAKIRVHYVEAQEKVDIDGIFGM